MVLAGGAGWAGCWEKRRKKEWGKEVSESKIKFGGGGRHHCTHVQYELGNFAFLHVCVAELRAEEKKKIYSTSWIKKSPNKRKTGENMGNAASP